MDKLNNQKLSKNHLNEAKFILSLLKGVRDYYILWIISKDKIHGYGIISHLNEVASSIDEHKVVHSSTVYPILYSLEEKGLIKSTEEVNNNHKIKLYEITTEGLIKLDNIKKCIDTQNSELISFIDDMIFNDKNFTHEYGDE